MSEEQQVGEHPGRDRAAGWTARPPAPLLVPRLPRATPPHEPSALALAMSHSLANAERALEAERSFALEAECELLRRVHALRVGGLALARCTASTPTASALLVQQRRGLDAAAALLESLVHLGQLEQGLRSVHEAPVAVDGLLETMLERRGAAATSGVAVAGQAGRANCDAALAADVLGLLVDESLESRPEARVAVEARAAGPAIELSVATQARRACPGEETAPYRSASSLRLRIARRLAQHLGARLELRAGRAVLLLPAATDQDGAVRPTDAATRLPPGLRVLVVDDDAAVRLALRLLLEADGLRVRVAESVEEAERSIAVEQPDAIVGDARVAGAPASPALIARLRAHCGRSVPVVLTSADVGAPAGLPEGTTVLEKPFAAEALRRALGTALLSAGSPASG